MLIIARTDIGTRLNNGHHNVPARGGESFTKVASSVSDSALPHGVTTIVAALTRLGMRIGDRVLIMLPDGPGFAELVTCVAQEGGVPLPMNPQLNAQVVVKVATAARARIVLVPIDRIDTLADLNAGPPVMMNGPQGPWAAGFRLP